jgi:hypothetical protein
MSGGNSSSSVTYVGVQFVVLARSYQSILFSTAIYVSFVAGLGIQQFPNQDDLCRRGHTANRKYRDSAYGNDIEKSGGRLLDFGLDEGIFRIAATLSSP